MCQPGLIESIINDVGPAMSSNTKYTPFDRILYNDSTGTQREDTWNYHSVIGKLNFLAQNTCPDISFVVHQCVHFCTKPIKLYEMAVKRIFRYPIHTKDKGLILHPSKDFTSDMCVDANFATMRHQKDSTLHDNVLSRTGYVITYCSCPIHWVSKLQTETALSTTKREYIVLSVATRELPPLWNILLELHQHSLVQTHLHHDFNITHTPSFSPTHIYEDNEACIILATRDH